MPVDLSQLSAEDRQDFERRLGVYGMNASAVQEPLAVTSSAVTLAYGPNRPSARAPFVLQTRDFAAVKRMVGIDDRVLRNVAPRVTLPGAIELGGRRPTGIAGAIGAIRDPESRGYTAAPGLAMDDPGQAAALSDADLNALDDESINNIRIAARAYVRGNSQLVASYRPLVERVVGQVTIPIWAILNVTVASGSVLEFGPGVNVLVAHKVTIESGGRIRSRGHLTVNCTSITKPGRIIARPLNPNLIGGAVFRPIFSE
jgi:hypothetical protein